MRRLLDLDNKRVILLAIYSPSYDKQIQSNNLTSILNSITATIGISEIIRLGDFNLPSVKWSFDYSELSTTDELFPYSVDKGEENIFLNKILEMDFTQKNYLPNRNDVFLDLLFTNFDLKVLTSHRTGIDLIDRESLHHPAFLFEIRVETETPETMNAYTTKLDYSKMITSEFIQGSRAISTTASLLWLLAMK